MQRHRDPTWVLHGIPISPGYLGLLGGRVNLGAGVSNLFLGFTVRGTANVTGEIMSSRCFRNQACRRFVAACNSGEWSTRQTGHSPRWRLGTAADELMPASLWRGG